MSDLLLRPETLADMRTQTDLTMPNVVTITTPGALASDGMGGQIPGSPTVLTTIGALLPLGQTPQELAIASQAAGQHVVVVLLPANTAITEQDGLTIDGLAVHVLGVIDRGQWEPSRRVVGKVIV